MITDAIPGFKPLLSGQLKWEKLKYPVLVSPKLDGIRALSYKNKLYSRTLKLIPNKYIQDIAKQFPSRFDGELIVGEPNDPNCMQNTSSGVMSFEGRPHFRYYAFDNFGRDTPFTDRLNSVKEWCRVLGNPWVTAVEHVLCYDEAHVRYQIDRWVDNGYEGIMIRDPNGRYKYGRSTANEGILLKHKVFETEWAKVIGFEELMHNENEAEIDHLGHQKRGHSNAGKVQSGMLGALIVQSPVWEKTFNLGSGFDQAQRIAIWANPEEYMGKTVEFTYQPHGTLDAPRTPIFKSFREDM